MWWNFLNKLNKSQIYKNKIQNIENDRHRINNLLENTINYLRMK